MTHRPVIIFDWDGTLADSMDLCVAEVRGALEKLGLPIPPVEAMRACNGPTYEETIPMLGIPAEMGQTYMQVRKQCGLEMCEQVNRLFPGIRDMLLRLKMRARLCIASNGGDAYIALCCRIFGLENVFDRVEAFQRGRSKAEAVGRILRDDPEAAAIMVGDRLGDIHAGKANGLQTVCCAYGYGTPEEWAQADRTAASVEELEALLTAFTQGRLA